MSPSVLQLRLADGTMRPLNAERWYGEPSPGEMRLLQDMAGPVLDVGCGPGRLVVGLGRLRVVALGIDPAPGAVRACRQRGAPVLQRSVFQRIPAEGRWRTVLLADGNIGIGGDPARLLARCRELTGPDGHVLVELAPPGTGIRQHRARLECGEVVGPWFDWAEVGVDAVAEVAASAGLAPFNCQSLAGEGRWFATLGTAQSAEQTIGAANAVA
jgi:SAM-dependent methyltransferase